MGEINSETLTKKKGTKGKKLSTRVDLTPMVDLGFLLITFFIFTTSLSRPKVMNLILPADGGESTTPQSKTISLILSGDNKIKWYEGNQLTSIHETNYAAGGLRTVLQQKKASVSAAFGNDAKPVVLIKPTNDATYANVVDALDEMSINNIKTYVLMDPDSTELAAINVANR